MSDNVTLKAIGERVGYSKNTVSLALRGDPQIPPRTRRRICKVAREMGYRPNALVSHLMARLRSSNANVPFRATLALVNAHPRRDAVTSDAAIAGSVAGCNARASQLGFRFDEFWVNDEDATASRWLRILSTRAIQGVILVGRPDDGQLPAELEPVWRRFPTVVAGLRPHGVDLPFTSVDHYDIPRLAVRKAIELGYGRPALVIDDRSDRLVDGRFGAGMAAAQQLLPERNRIPSFTDDGTADAGAFARWFADARPDVILSSHHLLPTWLQACGIVWPDQVGVIQLDRPEGDGGFAGVDQHHFLVGKAAVDLVVSAIHCSTTHAAVIPTATLIGTSWVDGRSVRPSGWSQLEPVHELGRVPGVAA